MPASGGERKGGRGRPSADQGRNVAADLIRVAEQYVNERSHFDITEKEIAARAGTSDSMIHYYFGNKEGLLMAMMQKCIDEAYEELCRLEKNILTNQENATRRIIDVVDRLNRRYVAVTKVGLPEMMREDSKINRFYVQKQDARTFSKTCDIVRALVRMGVYRPETNVELAVTAIISLMVAPVWQSAMLATRGIAGDTFHSEEWLSYVTTLLDRQLRDNIVAPVEEIERRRD